MRQLFIALMLVLVCISALALSACDDEIDREQQLIQQGYTVKVFYDANGGRFGTDDQFAVRVKPYSAVPPPGYAKVPNVAMRDGYTLRGWALGTQVAGQPVISDTLWDFQADRVAEDDITLYAVWRRTFVFRFVHGDEALGEYTDIDATSSRKLPSAYSTLKALRKSLKVSDKSLYRVFADQAKSQEIDDLSDVEHPFDLDGDIAVRFYTEYIDGEYVFVSSPSEMIPDGIINNFWLERDLDFEGASWGITGSGIYTGTIVGNGHTISNLVVTYDNVYSQTNFGLVSVLLGATISELTFDNCTVHVIFDGQPTSMDRRIGMMAGWVRDQSVVTDIIFVDCSIIIDVAYGIFATTEPAYDHYFYQVDTDCQLDNLSGTIDIQ